MSVQTRWIEYRGHLKRANERSKQMVEVTE